MTGDTPRSHELSGYLHPGEDQDRLLRLMDHGHARARHGEELGNPSSTEFTRRIAKHLRTAREAYAVDSMGYRTYLIVDRKRNQIAWIPPHKEHRATLFQPDDGVADYVATKRAGRNATLTRIDIARLRQMAPSADRSGARAVSSAQRSAHAPGLTR